MRTVFLLAVALFCTDRYSLAQTNPASPTFSAATIINAASGLSGSYSPYGLIAIHGSGLALSTAWANLEESPALPVILANGGTRVLIHNMPAGLLYVSPTQIVCLPPPDLPLGPASVQVVVSSLASQPVTIVFSVASPAFFLQAEGIAAATHFETGSNVSTEEPAVPGDSVVLFAVGLGVTFPIPDDFTIPRAFAPLVAPFRVTLDGSELPSTYIDYVGLHPGLAGSYQVRFRLPPDVLPNPEVRIEVNGVISPESIRLPVLAPEAADVSVVRENLPDRLR